MKRRDFIKAFGGASAALASASTLANIAGSEKVIKTFQMSDIENESYVAFTKETEFGKYSGGVKLENDISSGDITIIEAQNPSYKRSVLVLSYDHHQLNDFKKYNIDFLKEKNIHLSRISRRERLLGIKRGSSIIGLSY